ncbi:phytoene dehydrogenase [Pseudoalteromonas sp. HM-SA03]|uniref:phytoene desaturase family protein n=1 Tax=Pseudoalteromonas sp. HM-SA03 TaxID=2029678 RepID=UPI000BADE0F9|nr:NAD(P)/FAD-dependent oxidoreductase [Pseudoalteromonas sp. HM-SA03]PAY00359.1 phytoene dehydrogenase [Pseudoalteromonas sp. HM-SA03]
MSEQQKSVIIIGAGMSGLGTAAYSQMNGYQCTVFELHETPGGCCTSWQRKEYTFDWCISWLNGTGTNNEMATIWDELGCLENVPIYNTEIFNSVVTTNGEKIRFYVDPDKLESTLIKRFPEDRKLIIELCGHIRKLQKCMPYFPFLKSGGLMTWWEKSKMMWQLLPYMRTFMKTLAVTMEDFSKRFSNPTLAEALNWIIFDRHSELRLMPFVFNLACAANQNAGVPSIGSLGLAKRLANRAKELGANIQYKSKVEHILIDNDRVVGVQLADGSLHYADYVVASCDSYKLTRKMLQNRYPHPVLDKLLTKLEEDANSVVFPGCVAVFIAVDADYSDHDPYTSYLLPESISRQLVGNYHSGVGVQIRNTLYPDHAPSGKSVLYVTYLSKSDAWQAMEQNVVQSTSSGQSRNPYTRKRRSPEYKQAKKKVGQAIVEFLDQYFEGLSDKVEFIDVVTPLTCERYTENHNGTVLAWHPFAPLTEELENYQIKHGPTFPNLDNFYYAGQWSTFSGVTHSTASGRYVAQYLCRQDKKPFRVCYSEQQSTQSHLTNEADNYA